MVTKKKNPIIDILRLLSSKGLWTVDNWTSLGNINPGFYCINSIQCGFNNKKNKLFINSPIKNFMKKYIKNTIWKFKDNEWHFSNFDYQITKNLLAKTFKINELLLEKNDLNNELNEAYDKINLQSEYISKVNHKDTLILEYYTIDLNSTTKSKVDYAEIVDSVEDAKNKVLNYYKENLINPSQIDIRNYYKIMLYENTSRSNLVKQIMFGLPNHVWGKNEHDNKKWFAGYGNTIKWTDNIYIAEQWLINLICNIILC